jgi:hypothetical protein
MYLHELTAHWGYLFDHFRRPLTAGVKQIAENQVIELPLPRNDPTLSFV